VGWNGGYGNYIVIRHGNGVQTLYAHLSSVSVAPGAYVAQGQTIGGMGNTGKSTGTHLHFEVRGGSNPF
jgi:murein DD-endopeptidase MepM/ murein hydrolase activator NlpD